MVQKDQYHLLGLYLQWHLEIQQVQETQPDPVVQKDPLDQMGQYLLVFQQVLMVQRALLVKNKYICNNLQSLNENRINKLNLGNLHCKHLTVLLMSKGAEHKNELPIGPAGP